MKWIALIFLAAAGFDAISTDEAADHQITAACGDDVLCIRRHHLARRTALGSHVADPVQRFMPYATPCPTVTWTAFRACTDARP